MGVKQTFLNMAAGGMKLLQGAGFVPPPRPDNTANAPADPAVVTGSYEFIIPQMFGDTAIVNTPVIPPGFRDNATPMPLNLYGLSGLTGGGVTGLTPNVSQGAVFYVDPETGSYVDLSQIYGVNVGGAVQ